MMRKNVLLIAWEDQIITIYHHLNFNRGPISVINRIKAEYFCYCRRFLYMMCGTPSLSQSIKSVSLYCDHFPIEPLKRSNSRGKKKLNQHIDRPLANCSAVIKLITKINRAKLYCGQCNYCMVHNLKNKNNETFLEKGKNWEKPISRPQRIKLQSLEFLARAQTQE